MKELRHLFISNFIKGASLMLGMTLVFTVVYAVSFPDTPTGETAGGKFMNYFNAMLVNTGSSSDGTVKNSDKVDGLHASDLGGLSAATSGGSDKITLYGVTNCPTGWTKAYDGIVSTFSIVSGIVEGGMVNTNNTIVCAGDGRKLVNSPLNGNPDHNRYFLPLESYGYGTHDMTCAVCVR